MEKHHVCKIVVLCSIWKLFLCTVHCQIKAEPTDDSVPGGHSSSNTTSTIHTTHIPEEQAESEGEIHTDGEEWLPSNRDGAESESDEPSPSIKEESKKGMGKNQSSTVRFL